MWWLFLACVAVPQAAPPAPLPTVPDTPEPRQPPNPDIGADSFDGVEMSIRDLAPPLGPQALATTFELLGLEPPPGGIREARDGISVLGAGVLDGLKDGDRVLVAPGPDAEQQSILDEEALCSGDDACRHTEMARLIRLAWVTPTTVSAWIATSTFTSGAAHSNNTLSCGAWARPSGKRLGLDTELGAAERARRARQIATVIREVPDDYDVLATELGGVAWPGGESDAILLDGRGDPLLCMPVRVGPGGSTEVRRFGPIHGVRPAPRPWNPRSALFPEGVPASLVDASDEALLRARFAEDPVAAESVWGLWEEHGVYAGPETERDFDGGWRGALRLFPALPVGDARPQLQWLSTALRRFAGFFLEHPSPAWRWRPDLLRFFRSTRDGAPVRTPSAFAWIEPDGTWAISWNVNGSLNTSAEAVAQTLFHETFHLDDAAHGGWSAALSPTWEAIRARCGAQTRCLAPYAPNGTRVKGGTYYAFNPGNGVEEYAAELAVRYLLETEARDAGTPLPAFRCLNADNRAAWDALVGTFFPSDPVVECAG